MNSILFDYQVIVLKSDISNAVEIRKLSTVLDHHPMIGRWTVDLEDIDRVIRIETHVIGVDEIIALISSVGVECSELE